MVTETKPHVASKGNDDYMAVMFKLWDPFSPPITLQSTCHLPFWQEVYKPSLHCHVTNRMAWYVGAEGKQLRTLR